MWVKFKNFLKRFLPAPARTFNSQMQMVFQTMHELQNSIQSLNDKQESIRQDINQVKNDIPNKPVYWKNVSEREIVRRNWGDVCEQEDFKDRFLQLISGLDGDSITTIVRILSRQKKYLDSDSNQLDIYTREEQEELRSQKDHFKKEVFKVSDDVYIYKNYLLPINHFEAAVFCFRHGLDQVKTLERVKGKDIIDVGGFIGDSVLIFNELLPNRIFTFEALPENYSLLQKTLELNKLSNTIAENIALGADSGSIKMHVAGSSTSSVERPGISYSSVVEVPVTTLDDYVNKHIANIGLIKVDIEGAEQTFLAGAKKTIYEQKPILLISIYHNANDFFEIKPLLESWNLGYSFSIHKPPIRKITSETLLIAEVLDSW